MRGRTVFQILQASLVLLASLSLVTPTAWAEPASVESGQARWIKLGDQPIGTGLETVAVEVGLNAGAFERIRIATNGAELLIQELRVYFANGDMQRLSRDARIARNSRSEPFMIEGGPRDLDRIEMTFKGRAWGPQRDALLEVWAERADTGNRESVVLEDDWLLLGKKSVGASIDNSVFPVGRQAGRFDSIRLAVQRSDIAFHDIRVVYLDGVVDTLAVRRLIRAGDASPPLVLKGGEARFIREVELVQEANPEMPGQAVVQVYARRAAAMR